MTTRDVYVEHGDIFQLRWSQSDSGGGRRLKNKLRIRTEAAAFLAEARRRSGAGVLTLAVVAGRAVVLVLVSLW